MNLGRPAMTDKTFINRWSRVKTANNDKPDALGQISDAQGQSASLPMAPDDAAQAIDEQIPPDLPSVESLDGDSDYIPFLGENVPEELARKALRKLWTSDPVFANLDGLNDYDEDYSALGMVNMVVETAYKVGKGIVAEEKTEIEDASAAEKPVAEEQALEEESAGISEEEPIELAERSDESVPHGGKL